MTLLVPLTVEDLTAEWLTAVLRERGLLPRRTVVAVHNEDAGGLRGFAGQVLRLRLTFDGEVGEAPASLIAKLPAVDRFTGSPVGAYAAYANEISWYQEVSHRSPVRTPRLYWAGAAPAERRYCLLLEDMAALEEAEQEATRAQAEAAVSGLARLHGAFWGNEGSRIGKLVGASSVAERGRMAGANVRFGWEAFTGAFGDQLPDAFLAAGAPLAEALPRLWTEALRAPRTLIHGDYKIENLMFGKRGTPEELVMVDWQAAAVSFGVEDLARFLSMSLTVELRRELEGMLLGMYLRGLEASGVSGYDAAQLRSDYRVALLLAIAGPIGGVRQSAEGRFSGGPGLTAEDSERRQRAVEHSIQVSMERRIAAVIDNHALEVIETLL